MSIEPRKPLPRDMLPYDVPVGVPRVEVIARAMQHHFDATIRAKHNPFHTPMKWVDLDGDSKAEFEGYAAAIDAALVLTGAAA